MRIPRPTHTGNCERVRGARLTKTIAAPYPKPMPDPSNRDDAWVFAAVAASVDDSGAHAAWSDAAGVHGPARLEEAVRAWAGRTVVLRDPLFESAWIEEAVAAIGAPSPPTLDWLLALAPFGQARGLSALVARAEAMVDAPEGLERAAAVLHATYRLAEGRSQTHVDAGGPAASGKPA